MRRRVEEVQAGGPLEPVRSLRSFKPADRVAARLEISTGGWLRGRAAGIDVMGDGSLVPFRGGMRRDQLPRDTHEAAFDTVERELSG